MHPIEKVEAYAVVRDDLDVLRIAALEKQVEMWINAHKMLSDRFLDYRQRSDLVELIAFISTVTAIIFGFMLLMNAL